MSITLPSHPLPREFEMGLPAPRELRPPAGGPIQRINRLGDCWTAQVVLPPMTYATAMAWQADLRTAAETVVMPIPQPGLDVGNPGTPRVKGANQLGNALLVDGLTPGYSGKKGQFMSFAIAGQNFAYEFRSEWTAVAGEALIPIQPLIRVSPADNALVNIAAPVIEGWPSVAGGSRRITVEALVAGLTFQIEESE